MHRFINPLLLWLAHASHADLSVSVGQSAAIGVGPGVATTRRATGRPRAAGRAPAALWVAGGGVRFRSEFAERSGVRSLCAGRRGQAAPAKSSSLPSPFFTPARRFQW